MYAPVLVTAPAEPPVSLQEAKTHLRVDFADEDMLVGGYLEAATSYLDGHSGILGRCLVTQTWAQSFDDFAGCLRLPFAGVDIDSVEVTYLDANGAEQALASTVYAVLTDERGPYLELRSGQRWPSISSEAAAVTVEADYGYGAAAKVPSALKSAILLHVQALYERGDDTALMRSHAALIAPYRRISV